MKKQDKKTSDEQQTDKSLKSLKTVAIVLSSLAVILVLAAVGIGYFLWYSGGLHGSMFSSRDTAVPQPTAETIEDTLLDADWIDEEGNAYNYRDDVISILLMGIDYMGDKTEKWDAETVSNGGNADVLALVILDTSTFDFSILHIPRDTMTDVIAMDAEGNYIDTVRTNISASHSYGDGGALSCQLTADAVSRLLVGAPVNRYASLDWDALYTLNNILGGVQITFDYDCTEIHSTFHQGNTVILNNWYLRKMATYRNYSDVNSANTRGMRIMSVLKAMFNQVKDDIMEDPTVALEIFDKLSGYINTDLALSEITFLARNIGKMDFNADTVVRLQGEAVAGEQYAEFHADQDWIHEFVVEKFCVPAE